jgi:hypothetical protein
MESSEDATKIFVPTEDFPPGIVVAGVLNRAAQAGSLENRIGAKLELRGRGSAPGSSEDPTPLHFAVHSKDEEALNEIRKFCDAFRQEVIDDFMVGGRRSFDPPTTLEEFLYFCCTLCHANRDIQLQEMPHKYMKHFNHAFNPDQFFTMPPTGLRGLFKDFPHLFAVEKLGASTRMKCVAPKNSPFDAFLKLHKSVPDQHAKRRRVEANTDPVMLASSLRAIYACLKEACSTGLPLPAREIEGEFQKYWKIPLTLSFYGDVTPSSFVNQFPAIFDVQYDGIQSVVLPKPNPQFPDAEDDDYDPMADEAEKEKDDAKPDPAFEKDDIDVVKGSLQQLAGMLGSLSDANASTKRRCLPQLVQTLSDNRKQKNIVDGICKELFNVAHLNTPPTKGPGFQAAAAPTGGNMVMGKGGKKGGRW